MPQPSSGRTPGIARNLDGFNSKQEGIFSSPGNPALEGPPESLISAT